MTAATLQLGPWPEGLNLISNRDLSPFLAPTELGEAVNVILTPEGFIAPRPGCKVVTHEAFYAGIGPSGVIKILGSVVLPNGVVCALVNVYSGGDSSVYKVFSSTHIEHYFNAEGTEFTHVIQHNGITGHTGVIFCAKTDSKSYITPNQDLSAAPTLIPESGTDPNKNIFPGSDGGMIVKDRLFLYSSAQSKVMWSPATYILDWSRKQDAATVGDDIAGYENIEKTVDTDGIMSIEFFNNSFYIFKKNKTYLFTYQTAPVDDGYLRKISDEFGALDSTMYRGQVVVFNRKGVFRVDGTEFIDLQAKLNLRFEIPLDHNNIKPEDVFITDFNNNILIGYRDTNTVVPSHASPNTYYYCMNGYTGGWTKWDYSYTDNGEEIASPGSRKYVCQDNATVEQTVLFTTFDKRYLVYMDFMPKQTPNGAGTYHLDSNILDTTAHTKYYIPSVTVKTKASIGGSMLQYKKIYRTFIRFYLSDQSAPNQKYIDPWIGNEVDQTDLWEDIWNSFADEGLWTASINYNDYRFSTDQENDGNYLFYLYPNAKDKEIGNVEDSVRPKIYSIEPRLLQEQNTSVYRRAYQLPIPQQRAVEFVFELKRKWTSITSDLINPDTDRPIKAGYYFLLSGVWFDYNDKAGI